MPFPQQQPKKPPDNQVEGYQRVVDGKIVTVNAYAKKSTTSTTASEAVRRLPGRPRIAAKPGSYSSGRDLPGVLAKPHPPQPAPPPGAPDDLRRPQPSQ